jgi:hypothetical protein
MTLASTTSKIRHVLQARQTRQHECHWPGCGVQVPPAKLTCSRHWFKIPANLRMKIWTTYKPGQEDTMTPSKEYMEALKEVLEWMSQH